MQTESYTLIEDLSYHGNGEDYWKMDLALPEKQSGEKCPAVLFIHGGGWNSCTKREKFESFMIRKMTGLGFAAASVEYRLAKVAPFPAQIQDIRRAVRFLRANGDRYHINAEQIGVVGHSAGAHLALLTSMISADRWTDDDDSSHSAAFQAVMGLSGVYNLTALYKPGDPDFRPVFKKLLPGPEENMVDRLNGMSPFRHVRKGLPPILLIHGDSDNMVPVEQSIELAEKLQAAGTSPCELFICKGAGHINILEFPESAQRIETFFKNFLR